MRAKFPKLMRQLVFVLLAATLIGITQSGKALALTGAYSASDVIGQTTFDTDNTGSAANQLNSLWGSTAIDFDHHRLFVSDTENCRVLIYNMDSDNNLLDKTADKVLGQTDFGLDCSDVDYSDVNSTKYSNGLAYDSTNNRLFVSTEYAVKVFNLADGITNGETPVNIVGQADFDATDCEFNVSLCDLYGGIALDEANQKLFVLDETNQRVLTFDVNPDTITNGAPAEHELGQDNMDDNNSDCDSVDAIHLCGSEYGGIVYDASHKRLFVSDTYDNNRVMIWDLSGGITDGMAASRVLGQTGFDGTDCGTSQTGLCQPQGLGYDAVGQRLFVDDASNCRMMIWDLSGGITNGMAAAGVLGQADFNSSDCEQNSQSQFGYNYSNNVAFDPSHNRLYMPDYEGSRVLIFDFVHFTDPAGALTAGTLGNSYSYTLGTVNDQCTKTFSITGGSLPPGLTLNAATGVISGKLTTAGTYSFEAAVSDDCGDIGTFSEDPAYTITVSPGAPDTGFGQPSSNSAAQMLIIGGILGLALATRRFNKYSNWENK